MQKHIKHTWHFNHKPEKVWRFLTESKLLEQWLMKNDFEPIVGHTFMFTTKPLINMGFDGNVYCQVLEVQAYSKLSYTWKGGPGNGKIKLDSIVTWTIKPTENGTELSLEHSGFEGIGNFMAYLFMNKGWDTGVRKKLGSLLDKHHNE